VLGGGRGEQKKGTRKCKGCRSGEVERLDKKRE
jgi:hypothetical protein